ncbi:MAG: TRAP transporter small permease subunit [Alphaproteobacteria bacterium]
MMLLDYAKRLVLLGGKLSAWLFLPMLVLVAIFDITTRRFLQLGSTPAQELEWHFFFAGVTFALGYAYLKDKHVRIDILRERLSPRTRLWIERTFLLTIMIPFALVIIWFGGRMTWLSYAQGEGSRAALGLPYRWLVKATLPIGAFLLLLACFYRLFRPMDSETPSSDGLTSPDRNTSISRDQTP